MPVKNRATPLNPFVPLVAMVAAFASALLFGFGMASSFWGLFLVIASPLPIYVAGLGWGSLASGFAGVLAVTCLLMFFDPVMTSVYSLGFVVPAFILTHLAIQPVSGTDEAPRWLASSALARVFLVVGLVEITLLTIVLTMTEAGLAGTVRGNLHEVASWFEQSDEESRQAMADLVDFWDSLVPGTLVGGIMIGHAVMGALAQGLLVSFATPMRPSPVFWQLRLPVWPSIAALVAAAVALGVDTLAGSTGGMAAFVVYLATGFVLVLGTGFLLQGLAVLHALTRGLGMQPLFLMAAYVVVLVFQPFGALAFAAVGFADCWAGFRERFGVADGA